MSHPSDTLDENIYLLRTDPPTKDDADEKGNVLYFCPRFGWYSGYFIKPHMDGTTHWTYLPHRPPALPDPAVESDTHFNDWLKSFPTKFEDSVIALFRLGWNAGWKRARGN
jgi:hypothetical protein